MYTYICKYLSIYLSIYLSNTYNITGRYFRAEYVLIVLSVKLFSAMVIVVSCFK